jgi:hypothetical protein
MKKIMIALLLLLPSLGFAESKIGKEIEPLKREDGSPHLGIQYAVSQDRFFSISLSVRGSDLIGNIPTSIKNTYWAFFHKDSGTQMTYWVYTDVGTGETLPSSTVAFMLPLFDYAQIHQVTMNLRDLAIVLAVKKSNDNVKPSVYIDMKKICDAHPEKVVNLDTGAIGCFR